MRLRECKIREGKICCDLCKRADVAPITETQFPQGKGEKGRMHWIDLCADCIEQKRRDPQEFAALGEFVTYPESAAEPSPRAPSLPKALLDVLVPRAPRMRRRVAKTG